MLSSHIDQIIKNSNKKLLVKAADYIDFISIIDENDDDIFATVVGSSQNKYFLNISSKNTFCSCPAEKDCKHIVALALKKSKKTQTNHPTNFKNYEYLDEEIVIKNFEDAIKEKDINKRLQEIFELLKLINFHFKNNTVIIDSFTDYGSIFYLICDYFERSINKNKKFSFYKSAEYFNKIKDGVFEINNILDTTFFTK